MSCATLRFLIRECDAFQKPLELNFEKGQLTVDEHGHVKKRQEGDPLQLQQKVHRIFQAGIVKSMRQANLGISAKRMEGGDHDHSHDHTHDHHHESEEQESSFYETPE